jgi:hypothetical protein
MSDEPKERRLSPTQLAIAGLGAAIVLVLIMMLISLGDLLSG